MTQQDFYSAFTLLFTAYRQPVDPAFIAIAWEDIGERPEHVIKAALKKARHKFEFVPAMSKLIELCDEAQASSYRIRVEAENEARRIAHDAEVAAMTDEQKAKTTALLRKAMGSFKMIGGGS